jgi:hypothetical protein
VAVAGVRQRHRSACVKHRSRSAGVKHHSISIGIEHHNRIAASGGQAAWPAFD